MNNKLEWALMRLGTRVSHFSLAQILGLVVVDATLTAVIVVAICKAVQS